MADTPWVGYDDKLYLQSGAFTSTLKDSEDISGIANNPKGTDWDGTNTPFVETPTDKLFLTSGQFTSVIKDSINVTGVDSGPRGMSESGGNTPWCGNEADKLYLTSGQFTATLKDSWLTTGVRANPEAISWAGSHTPWTSVIATTKLFLQSGQFTSTLKASEDIGGIDGNPMGISWDGTNTPWCGADATKLYMQSGQFTSTLKDSEDVSGIEGSFMGGISTNDYTGRDTPVSAVYNKSESHTITLGQVIAVTRVITRSESSTASFGQVIAADKVISRSVSSTLSLGQTTAAVKILIRSESSTLSLTQTIRGVKPTQIASNTISFTQVITPSLEKTSICLERLEWARWIFASVTKYFNMIAQGNNLELFIEGTYRDTDEYQKYIELRMDGPNFTTLSRNYFRLDVIINVLWGFNQDDEDFHETERMKGILANAMDNICIYRYGDGALDDDSLLGVLQLVNNSRVATRVHDFGQVRPDVRLMQGTVEGTYVMHLTCN